MALNKVTYVDNVTIIGAANLNAIQDAIIENTDSIGDLSDLNTTAKTDLVSAINEAAESGGSGISTNARTMLISILREALYKSDQSSNITTLDTLLQSGGGSTKATITNSLSHVITSNPQTRISFGDEYTAELTAESGYAINSVTVFMGGVDITESAYSNGVITISSVSGDILITASAAVQGLLYDWDLTSSLTDTVNNTVATVNGVSIADDGISFSERTHAITFPQVYAVGRTYELDIVESNVSDVSFNGRLFMVDTYARGLVTRVSQGTFQLYGTAWETGLGTWASNKNYFSGKTLKIVVGETGTWKIYADSELLYTSTTAFNYTGGVRIGNTTAYGTDGCYQPMRITGFRVYEGERI